MGRVSRAVVLAAGKGTRLPLGLPKVLTPIAGRPMIRYLLDTLGDLFPPEQTLLVIGHRAGEVRAALGDSYRYVFQEEQLGTGHALAVCRSALEPDANVLVVGGDTPLVKAETLRQLVAHHEATGADITILTCLGGNPAGMGRVLRDAAGRVVGVVEEREAEPRQRRIPEWNTGIYALNLGPLWAGLASLPRAANGEYYLTKLVGWAAQRGLRVEDLTVFDSEEVLGINTAADLLRAERQVFAGVRAALLEQGVRIIGSDAVWVEPSVEVGAGSVLLPLTYLGGKTRVDPGCRIGPRAVLLDCEVGAGSWVRDTFLEGCRVEPGTRIPADPGGQGGQEAGILSL
ncbi:MAG: bifunctional UDP-N-acetylglucosamine diphosphorylase/glucosamine-1-phosphate N-acetyltransferase GlmU [Chloroflexota bacterium]